jgi:hypothetical protein
MSMDQSSTVAIGVVNMTFSNESSSLYKFAVSFVFSSTNGFAPTVSEFVVQVLIVFVQ